MQGRNLRDNDECFQALFEGGTDGILLHWVGRDAAESRFFGGNAAACRLLGQSREELLALSPLDIDAADSGLDFPTLTRQLLRDKRAVCELTWTAENGRRTVVEVTSRLFRRHGRPAAVSVVRDVSWRKWAETERELLLAVQSGQTEFLQRLVDNAPIAIAILRGEDLHIGLVNPTCQKIFGSGVTMTGRTFREVFPGSSSRRQERRLRGALRRKLSLEFRDLPAPAKAGDDPTWCEGRVLPLPHVAEQPGSLLVLAWDITERFQAEDRFREHQKHLQYLAYHDALTDLPNRILFREQLTAAMAAANRADEKLAVLLLDLDRFKNINDSLGHQAGDKVLREVADRLKYWVRQSDTVARLGGDEFGIILNAITDFGQVSAIAKKLLAILPQPMHVETHELSITGSLGVSIFPDDAEEEDNLLKFADAAMYRAKERGRNNSQFFTPDMNARTHEFLIMENALRKGLEHEQFLLHYQPQIDLEKRAIVGVEALIRWRHPHLGMVPPGDFISLAEETGIIVPIGAWVLETACRQARFWQEAGLPPLRVAVNISGRQFREPDFVDKVERILTDSGLEPRFLELEITESVMMENVEKAIRTLVELKARGIFLSIDDFGTGYSSLSYLKQFPIHSLKIDRAFVRDVTTDPSDAAIASSVIALAHSMGLKVVGEGIETEEQLRFLREKGCDLGQGYLFSRPLPAGEMAEEIARWQHPAPLTPREVRHYAVP